MAESRATKFFIDTEFIESGPHRPIELTNSAGAAVCIRCGGTTGLIKLPKCPECNEYATYQTPDGTFWGFKRTSLAVGRFASIQGVKTMKVYSKEYGWRRTTSFWMWITALLICRGQHAWFDLGDPCYCGSDNCAKCANCGYEVHD